MFMVSGSFELLPAAALAEARRKLDVRLRRKLFCWTMPPTLPHMRDDRSPPVGTVAVVPGASREGGRTEVPGTAVVLRRPCEDMRRSRADMPRGRDMSEVGRVLGCCGGHRGHCDPVQRVGGRPLFGR